MTCPRCHAENRDGLRFCEDCGSQLRLTCAQCGGELAPGKRFCGSCGTPAAGQSAARTASPESYTPKHLAEKILTSKAALEGERKQVTVLFADLKGSMELLADRDPEEARKLLDPVLERMMEAVHRYEGIVNQVMGDGIMALFGAPVAHEDHAVRACYAALDMQAAIRRYAEEARRTHGVGGVQIRVGLNSGEVVVRAIGSDLRMDYSAVGQTTHLAARMEQLANAGGTLLAADTLRLAEGYVEVKPLGPVPVKGLDVPVDVYELVGAGVLRSRLHAASVRGLTRFVGRDHELEQLRQALARTGTGHGQVLAIVGEPGVGKSRLVWEVTHSHRTHGWLILESGSVSYGKASPYLPAIDLLKAYFKIRDRDDHREIREKVTGKLLTLDEALKPTVSAFLALLDVPVEDAQWQALDPPQRRQRTLDALKRLLLRESQVQPLVVVFEDLHWIDTETQALLDTLVDSLPTARLFLLVNYRPEFEHHWGGKTYYTQLRVDPLPPERADELLETLLGPDPGLGPLKRLLIERTEGNPFFLEESARTLIESRALAGERGAYRLTTALPAVQVPVTVKAVLAARIDRLPAEGKRLLQSAAVIGKNVPFDLLRAITGGPEDEVRRELMRLRAAEFLYETRLEPDLEYTFKHALTHEVALASLLQETRRALHVRLVEAIEHLAPDRLAEHVDRLSHHATQGELWEQAVRYGQQAGARAFAQSAYRQAAHAYEQTLEALGRLPESRERTEREVDLCLELRRTLFPLGEADRIAEVLGRAERLAEGLADHVRLGHASAFLGNYFWWTGQPTRAVSAQARGSALSQWSLHYAFGLGQAYHAQGDYQQAIECLAATVTFLSGDRIRERPLPASGFPSVFARVTLAASLAQTGEIDEAQRHLGDAMALAEELDNALNLVQACAEEGRLAVFNGELHRATAPLERALQVGEQVKLAYWRPWVLATLGHVCALTGRLADAWPLFERARDHATATRFMFGESLRTAWWAEAHLLAGCVDDAVETARRALDLARQHGEQGHEGWVLHLFGEIAVRRDPPDAEAAERHYREAISRAEALGMRPLVAHCHLGLGTLYRRTGDRAKAEEHLTTAMAMYREMGMTFWLEKADTALGGVER
jgi:class 3 adenylate cyclase/tetratricopeptide (TPR) repeat protein